MHLSVYVFGLEEFESRELDELLGALDEVDQIAARLSRDSVQPGVIYASAEYVHYSIQLGGAIVVGVLSGALREAGKDLYSAAKERVRKQIADWVEARNEESKRERIHFTLAESGEMMVTVGRGSQEEDS